MATLPAFKGFDQYFLENTDKFKHIYDSNQPQDEAIPEPWQSLWDEFERMIFIKSFRSDKVIPCVQNWITNQIGRQFIIPPVFDLSKCYKDSTIFTPLIFVLSAGSDPVADFLKFASEKEMMKRYD
jgi:dynein heavy chain, axonemal